MTNNTYFIFNEMNGTHETTVTRCDATTWADAIEEAWQEWENLSDEDKSLCGEFYLEGFAADDEQNPVTRYVICGGIPEIHPE